MIQKKIVYTVFKFDETKNDWVLVYKTDNPTFAKGWTSPNYKIIKEEFVNEQPEPKIGRIFFDETSHLWKLCLYDKDDRLIDIFHYNRYKRDSLARMKDYPTVERWEVGKRR